MNNEWNCKDCEYFERIEYIDSVDELFGVCKSGKIIYEEHLMEMPKNPESYLFYTDNEDYMATHKVGINFGCKYFKEKKIKENIK